MTRTLANLAAVFLLVLGGCKGMTGVRGSGVAKMETRELSAFEAIDLSGVGRLEVAVGKAGPLTLTTDDNLLPLVITEVRENRLVIRESERINPQTPLVISVATPKLSGVEVSGAAHCIVKDLSGDSFEASVSGAGTVEAAGAVKSLSVSISGAGDVKAFDLKCEQAEVSLGGAGAAEINAARSLKAGISGVGRVTYMGEPAVEKSVTGAGRIERRQ